jgi:hypothetical protein
MTDVALVLPTDDPAVIDYRTRAAAVKASADALVVDSEETKVEAVNILSAIARVTAEAEKKRKAIVAPFNDHVKDVNALFKATLAPIVDADVLLRRKVLDYNAEASRKAATAAADAQRQALAAQALLDQAAKAEAQGQPEVAEQLLTQAVENETGSKASAGVAAVLPVRTVKSDIGEASTRKTWAFKVVNLAEVPREYLILDAVAIRKAIAGGVRSIAGLDIFQEEGLAVKK